ncbi:resistance to homoserine/threonine (RhtB) family protein [Micromonospora rhizosphaerae]|uniref:Resistance to homoserine/threonine (RhtB) family protein n=1 Tax=Micromonospora rhizosphaerae TaxID=568872 RepID=A0A1C6SLF3_9ACTN|nr:LysE family translocator [Micromonospora rhizosphaerae]SCL30364.1 resistance to homoserine/threonine (RhtB) family protein [Micromonospora rhizosphaerae]
MTVTTGQVIAFAAVMAVGALSPGPDFAIVVRRAAVSGRTRGMATAAGIAAGVFIWAVAAATGVATLLAASAVAFTAVKVVGAAYLAWLGVRALVAAAHGGGGTLGEPDGRDDTTLPAAFRQGLLCNVLNPKAAVFFVALMPQFLRPDATVVDAVVLATVAAAVALLWFLGVANLVAAMRRLLDRPRVRRAIDAVTGVALIGLGVRLAATRF